MPIPVSIAPDQGAVVATGGTNVNLCVTVATATRSNTLRECQTSAEGTTSAAQEILLARVSTVGVTPAGAYAARPLNVNYTPGMSALASRVAGVAAFATEALIVSGTLYRWGLNANGALFRWVAAPGLGIDTQGGGVINVNQLALYCKAGSVSIPYSMLFDEN